MANGLHTVESVIEFDRQMKLIPCFLFTELKVTLNSPSRFQNLTRVKILSIVVMMTFAYSVTMNTSDLTMYIAMQCTYLQ